MKKFKEIPRTGIRAKRRPSAAGPWLAAPLARPQARDGGMLATKGARSSLSSTGASFASRLGCKGRGDFLGVQDFTFVLGLLAKGFLGSRQPGITEGLRVLRNPKEVCGVPGNRH